MSHHLRFIKRADVLFRSNLRGTQAHVCPQCRQFFSSRKTQGSPRNSNTGQSDNGESKEETWTFLGFSWPKLEWSMIPTSVGFACIGVLAFRRSQERHERNRTRAEETATIYNGIEIDSWKIQVGTILPTRIMSRAWGWLSSLHLPVWARRPLLGLYARVYSCDMSEAVEGEDLAQYESLLALFSRNIKSELRPIGDKHPLVSPCDGTIAHVAKMDERHMVEQVKGVSYPVQALYGPSIGPSLSSSQDADEGGKRDGMHLYQYIVYLSPGDYHHYHSPTTWAVHHRRHFSGELLPVAPPLFKRVPGLMALNERVVLTGTWQHGFFSMIAVGALNVGSMKIAFDKNLETNLDENYMPGFYRDLKLSNVDLKHGSYVGRFVLGSTVAVVFEAPADFQFLVKAGDKVRFGQPVGSCGDANGARAA
ncbi:phosphatidylserine decarboxylase proenzyme, mitochondrial-like [Sycon ciliatum]|uniref:phosphatidylserine decarboxylase proenzyme, mitochondrial-like n=1 Tax=Sycon ciliatum TaxID=27933 RepID=UPI0031F69B82